MTLRELPALNGITLDKGTWEERDAKKYRSIAGKAMFMVTKMLTEAAYAVCELTKFYKEPEQIHCEALIYLAGYLKQEGKKIMLNFRPPREIYFRDLVDANFTNEREERKSVTGRIYSLGGCTIVWNFKTQTCTALLSTEAEYYAKSQGGQELLFIQDMLRKIEVSKDSRF